MHTLWASIVLRTFQSIEYFLSINGFSSARAYSGWNPAIPQWLGYIHTQAQSSYIFNKRFLETVCWINTNYMHQFPTCDRRTINLSESFPLMCGSSMWGWYTSVQDTVKPHLKHREALCNIKYFFLEELFSIRIFNRRKYSFICFWTIL